MICVFVVKVGMLIAHGRTDSSTEVYMNDMLFWSSSNLNCGCWVNNTLFWSSSNLGCGW
jgi:hypothetical protein